MNRALRLSSALVLTSALILAPKPAFAVNKDMIQLQTQVQQLQDAVARLQQSNDERMGVLKDLVQQSADSVNRMGLSVDTLQKQLAAREGADGTKIDQVSGQIQSLNDSLDELKARMVRLEKIMQDVQSQQQSMNAPQPIGGGPAAAPASAPPAAIDAPAPDATRTPAPVVRALPPSAPTSDAPPVEDLYKAALGDYMSAKYALATSEFGDLIKAYPDNTLSGNAWYYLGEMEYRAGRYAVAAKNYDHVIEQFPDNNKVPAAHLHKSSALMQLKQNDAGIREMRTLIQRFPNSPEAMQARSRLNGMGVPIRPRA
ncbi:outer membrane protein assembly factor BamD [Granulicella sp. WH15]|uniref:tetratricopeptide repeat protein n=1 Tax=Granulicella sp. WH15 TaxID=2602070 RepID=UPI0013677C76|nr:tetratricopeptide repeat protein [Granulicella sp. WH15]QHN04014.1 outer membrane protein assembly factor BamD [Granulicella sp. WH15]